MMSCSDTNVHEVSFTFPYSSLDNREFNLVTGNPSCDALSALDLFHILPNPDKFDECDSDLMLNVPNS